MALRNILGEGEPALLRKCRPVKEFDDRLHTLLDDMRETMLDAEGAGLAAPQVGVLRRAVVVMDFTIEDSEPSDCIIELINPEITQMEGEQEGLEGCLSLPGKMGIVKRPMKVKVKAYDRFGKEFEVEREALTARAICHELDHLDGILYTTLASTVFDNEELDEYLNAEGGE